MLFNFKIIQVKRQMPVKKLRKWIVPLAVLYLLYNFGSLLFHWRSAQPHKKFSKNIGNKIAGISLEQYEANFNVLQSVSVNKTYALNAKKRTLYLVNCDGTEINNEMLLQLIKYLRSNNNLIVIVASSKDPFINNVRTLASLYNISFIQTSPSDSTELNTKQSTNPSNFLRSKAIIVTDVVFLNVNKFLQPRSFFAILKSLQKPIECPFYFSKSYSKTATKSEMIFLEQFTYKFVFGGTTDFVMCVLKCITTVDHEKINIIQCIAKNCIIHYYLRNLEVNPTTVKGYTVVYLQMKSSKDILTCKKYDSFYQSKPQANIYYKEPVHLVYSSNNFHLEGLKASVKSIIKTSSNRANLHFHIFNCLDFDPMNTSVINMIQSIVLKCGSSLHIHNFTSTEVQPYINTHMTRRKELKSPHNYARFILADRLKYVEKCIWMDSDILTVKDINRFMTAVNGNKVIAAFPQFKEQYLSTYYKTLKKLGVKVADSATPWFSAGIMVINLNKWRRDGITDQMLKIVALNEERKLYTNFGSQPAFNFLFSGDRFEQLDSALYIQNLGYLSLAVPCQVQFIHWSGQQKPWQPTARNTDLWVKLDYKTNHINSFTCETTV